MAVRHFEQYEPKIANTAFIDDTALVIGNVVVGEHSSIWPYTVLRGDVNQITIGDYTNLQDATVVHVNHASEHYNPEGDPTIIGHEVTVGHRALIHACTIQDRCLIGMQACIMDKAVVESDVIIGAGSLVTPGKVLASGYLYVGSPARKIRALTDQEREKIQYSARYYSELAKRHQVE